jgi:hypothetical protein
VKEVTKSIYPTTLTYLDIYEYLGYMLSGIHMSIFTLTTLTYTNT